MAGNNSIATGAVTLGVSADPLVAGLDAAAAKINAWGNKVQASMDAKNAGITDAMQAKWQSFSRTDRLISQQAKWDIMAPAGLGDYIAKMNTAAKATEDFTNKTQKSFDMNDKTGVMWGKVPEAKGGGVKDFAAGIGLAGILTKIAEASAKAFSEVEVNKFNTAMERSVEISSKLAAAVEKANSSRVTMLSDKAKADPNAGRAEIDAAIASAEKTLQGSQREAARLRAEKDAMDADMSRSLAKQLPFTGERFAKEEAELKGKLDDVTKAGERAASTLEALNKLKAEFSTKATQADFDGAMKEADEYYRQLSEDTEKTIDGFKRAADIVGMTEAEIAVYDAKKKGVNDLTDPGKLAALKLAAETAERKKNTAEIDKQLLAMEKQAASYGMTEAAAKRMELEAEKASEAQLQKFDLITAATDKMREAQNTPPKQWAGAIEAGSQQAIALDVKAKDGFFKDEKAETNTKLEAIRKDLKAELVKVNEKLAKLSGV